jgi:CubicO group peptidase (beta-lactamase class C family)
MRLLHDVRVFIPIPVLLLSAILTTALIPDSSAREQSPGLAQSPAEAIGLNPAHLQLIDAAVAAAIQRGEIPGAVVLVARNGRIGYFRAFGNRSVRPVQEPMTLGTMFDMASLTKVMATAPSIMLLVERGEIRLGDKVKRYLPKFTGGNKDDITVKQLMTHYSGLSPDFDLSKHWNGHDEAMEQLWKEKTVAEPGKEFSYSDLNFIALGEIVREVTGKGLDVFARENIYQPLEMAETMFSPPSSYRGRIAPTEPRANTLQYLKGLGTPEQAQEILRGEVHDPTAWRMGGVAGHAGLFSTASDTAVFLQWLLDEGVSRGKRLMAPMTVRAMTSPQNPAGSTSIRGLGWDIDSSYSAPRGDLFRGGYGHTGFSGTSAWVEPATKTLMVILTNRVHPEGKGDATHLRGAVANIVAAAIREVPAAAKQKGDSPH